MLLFSALTLSFDSLIVASALTGVVSRRHFAPLVALFGVCDATATMVGPMLGTQLTASSLLATIFLVLWGTMIMFNFGTIDRLCHSPVWAYLLPPLLAVDNLIVPCAQPAVAGLVSSGMTALGFAGGYILLRGSVSLTPKHRWVGAPLVVAGLLLTV